MGKRLIINEQQYYDLVLKRLVNESIFEASSMDEFKNELKKIVRKLLLTGVGIAAITFAISKYCDEKGLPSNVTHSIVKEVVPSDEDNNVANTNVKKEVTKDNIWTLVDDSTIATVYNAKPSQCDGDFGVTATMFRLNLYDVESHKIIAMERTFMDKLGLKRGDVVKIEGTGELDGVKQIQDVMNKRFKGQHRIDILVPDNISYGKWNNVKIYKLTDESLKDKFKSEMAPPISKKENEKQMLKKKEEYNSLKNN